ncbi:MAG TPA: alpha/beta hydrolase [Steroidobacteraceae bacterium]
MKKRFACLLSLAALAMAGQAIAQEPKPTIVLVHGAFADASSWTGVMRILSKDGYTVIGVANPLRGVKADGAYVGALIGAQKGSVVLVGHSYGGSVITAAADGHRNVKSLIYVSAFAPDQGESAADLVGKFPGSTLGPTLAPPVTLADGSKDLYIVPSKFHDQFAADVSPAEAAIMAAMQRPIAEAALNEKSDKAAWKQLPVWFIYGDKDKNIPPALMAFMAQRAHARDTVVVKGGSHVVMVSKPDVVAELIERAATAK